MTLPGSASTSAWMAQHSNSQEKVKLLTLTTWTWRNSFIIWNGTCAQRMPSTHFMKAVASQHPIPLYMNKELGFSGHCPVNRNNKVNNLDQQQQPSTCTSMKKHLHFTCSSSKMIGLPPQSCITYSMDSTFHNLNTPSGGKYSSKTMNYTTRSLTLKDTHTRLQDSMLEAWKLLPKKGMNVASPGHFSILSTPLQSHYLTNYLTNHLTQAPDLVLHG